MMNDDCMANLQHAADEGDAESMYILGICLARGCHIGKDEEAAAKWFHAADKQGHIKAKTSLGYLYATGRGVRKDLILAYVYITQSSQTGDKQADDILSRLRSRMSEDQIREAENRLQSTVAN